MKNPLYPSEYIDSAYTIDYEQMYEAGYRGIIFDIDNTLAFHGAPAKDDAVELFERLRNIGFNTCLLSNNKAPRVVPFANKVGSIFVSKAAKPSTKGYIKAMKRMRTSRKNTFFVGDQLFTDVWGANRTGIHSVLVKPLNPKEEIQIVLKRYLEKPILYCYTHRKMKDK